MENLDCFVILYAPGMGGNHLANLVSTAQGFDPRFAKDFYSQNYPHAHSAKDRFSINANKHSVMAMHMAEYHWNKQKINAVSRGVKVITLEFVPGDMRDLWWKRACALYPFYLDTYLSHELSYIYSFDHVQHLFNHRDITPIKVPMLFDQDVTALLSTLTQNFQLDFDAGFCQQIHESWYREISKCLI